MAGITVVLIPRSIQYLPAVLAMDGIIIISAFHPTQFLMEVLAMAGQM